jgi:hypothetical protein
MQASGPLIDDAHCVPAKNREACFTVFADITNSILITFPLVNVFLSTSRSRELFLPYS